MLKQFQKRKEAGFTIIEVLIVLAIAGLIMVVVFLAVPALQRSGRNNALNTDANNVLTAVGNYSSNNGGSLPQSLNGSASTTASGGVIKIGDTTNVNQETAKVDSGAATVYLNGTVITSASPTGTIQIVTGTTGNCNSTGTALSGTAGSPRGYAVLYVAESGTGNILKCVGN